MLGFFPHKPLHAGTGSSGYLPGKAPIKWSGQAARRFCDLPAFKLHFWGQKSCPFLQEVQRRTRRTHGREGGIPSEGTPTFPVPPPWKTAYFHNSRNSQPLGPGETHPHPGAPPRSRAGVAGRAGGAPSSQLGSDQTSRGCGAAAPSASRPLLALGRPRGAPSWRQPRQLCHVKSAAPIERVPSPGSNPITSAAVASLSAGRSSPRPGRFTPLAGPGSRGASIMRLMGC